MVIMSQDKQTVFDFGVGCTIWIGLGENGNGYGILAVSPGIERSHVALGAYDSKEECKQVIQSIFCAAEIGNKVFYMPEE